MRRRTSNNGTYAMGSHVMQYGSQLIDEEPAADYLGAANTGAGLGQGPDIYLTIICTWLLEACVGSWDWPRYGFRRAIM